MHRRMSQPRKSEFRIGIHIVLRPTTTSPPIPISESHRIEAKILNTALICQCTLKAFFAMPDHLHILIEASDEQTVAEFIPELAQVTEREIRSCGPNVSLDHFAWNSNIHVTLLPPWHIEILASFVRDQERYHKTRDVEQELREVFQSDSILESFGTS